MRIGIVGGSIAGCAAAVELTRAGTVVASHKLDKDRHKQPEGLALTDDGTLFIADEGGKGKAHLAIYRPGP